ncbi:MAG TPA: chloramphenicol acetyltransferase [Candidatus Omnitrophota bacterium]|mgnify:CR=1 FL=1|nr:chloramphenicol acetyltransferase [Candidatus Omnitrophota bacterium]HPS20393.1 chloramphenicol acetyltransferase [Candidatus Omnitrophota bacterium]
MEKIDLDKWPRKSHFEYFEGADYPYIDLTVQMDITNFFNAVKKSGYKFYPSLLYAFLKCFNSVEEFKYRIIGNDVVKFDTLDMSTTVPIEGDRFAFCIIKAHNNIREFLNEAQTVMDKAKKQTELSCDDRFDVVWVTCTPWFSFTSISAPIVDKKMRSIPLVSVGKYYGSGDKILLPVGLKANHALVDGVHIGKLLEHVQSYFDEPGKTFSFDNKT